MTISRYSLPVKEAVVGVPTSARLLDLIPAAQQLSEFSSQQEIALAETRGRSVSCKMGCGACCRQLVAISIVEAVALTNLVEAMPTERQRAVQQRFADVQAKLEAEGLLDPQGAKPRGIDADPELLKNNQLSSRYFDLQIACPFLENESCSIYTDRPSICREYHVTSPAERCSRLYQDPVDSNVPDIRMGPMLMKVGAKVADLPRNQVPIVLALEFGEHYRDVVSQVQSDIDLASTFQRIVDSESPSQPEEPPQDVTANIEMPIRSRRIALQVTVSTGPTTARELLPFAHGLTQIAGEIASDESEAAGKPVSCKAGCGACCRQLVPISQPEAYQLYDVVAAMPEPRRTDILQRFDNALSKLQEAELLVTLNSSELWSQTDPVAFGMDYFRLGIACPFLENESCSIHEVRPMTCRAFSVTSPAENCKNPSPENIVMLEHPLPRPLQAFGRAIAGSPEGTPTPWVPLITALNYAKSSAEPKPEQTGPELLQAVFQAMTGTSPQ